MTHRENVLRRLGFPTTIHLSLPMLAIHTGIPLSALQEVYNRGIGAYSSGKSKYGVSPSVRLKGSFKKGVDAPKSQKLSKEQWAYARVYSFIDKGTDYYTADKDIAVKYGI
jgi:hypothetical protein